MKNFDKVYSVNVILEFPAEWGNFFQIIDSVNGYALHDVVYQNFERWMSLTNQQLPPNDLGHMEDLCNGFDTNTVRVCVQIDGDMDVLSRTVEAMEKALHRAYMDIPYRKRKLAKGTK